MSLPVGVFEAPANARLAVSARVCPSKQHFDRFVRFCAVYPCAQHTHTDRHYTDISRCVQRLQQRAASTHRVWAIRQRMSVTIVPGKLKSFTVDSLGLLFLYSTGYCFHRYALNFSQDRNIFHPVTVNFDL